MYLKFAWRYFKAKKSAQAINWIAWVTTAVIAFATCCQVLVLSVFNGFEDLVKSLYASFYPDMKISPAAGKTFFLDSGQLEKIKTRPFVKSICLTAEEKALLTNENGQVVVTLKGVDSHYSSVSGLPGTITDGKFETGDRKFPALVLGSGISHSAGIFLNPVFAPPQMTAILPRSNTGSYDPLSLLSEGVLTVKGIFSIQQEFDNNYAITDITFMKEMMALKANEYSAAEISLTGKIKPEDARKEIQQLLGDGYVAQTKYEQNDSLYQTMKMEKWAIFAVLTLILIIAAFNMISALTMLVLEKRKDIQILQSMGAYPSQIRKIFLTEGALLGLLGAATGISLAVLICFLQLEFKLIKLTGGAFLIDYFPVKIIVWDLVLVAFSAAVISLLASLLPASKAASQKFELR